MKWGMVRGRLDDPMQNEETRGLNCISPERLSYIRRWVIDCKEILGEASVTQHPLLLTEFILEGGTKPKTHNKPVEKIRWHNLHNEDFERVVAPFVAQTKEWLQNNTDCERQNPIQMWVALDNKVINEAQKTLGVP